MVQTKRTFDISPQDPTPLYAQLERAIRFAMATGRIQVGEQLPTVRQLAVDLRINANTVARVYAELERAGLLETRRGVGTFARTSEPSVPDVTARENRLQELEDLFLNEAALLGFSARQACDHLAERLHKEQNRHG